MVIIGIIFIFWTWYSLSPVNSGDTKEVVVPIPPGQSLTKIAADLESRGLIRSAFAFKAYAKIKGLAGSLQAGAFGLNPAQSVGEILDTLHDGKSREFKVTIPEGYTVADIDAHMAAKGLGNPGDIIHCAFTCDFSTFEFLPATSAGSEKTVFGSRLEGYLFPETYSVNTTPYVPKFFLERMLGEFRERVVEQSAEDMKKSGRTLKDIVIMASLIEEESRHEEERSVISGILWKRLDNGVVLGVDAVNRYGLNKKGEPLTRVELETVTPWNSRRVQGLPPSAIANPSESSITAALNPTNSSHWYYLHDSAGVIHYAVTNDEHNENKVRYLGR